MASTQTTPRDKSISRWLRISGLVLWIAAAVAGFAVWRSARQTETGDATIRGGKTADDSALQPIPEKKPDGTDETANVRFDRRGMPLPAWNPDGLPDFEFTERSGRKVGKADLLGKPWAACFIFTRCAGPCPKVTGQMKLLQDRLKDVDVRLVTFTVDPDHDTPEVLTRWADQFDADPDKWLFLTGDKTAIYRLIIDGFRMNVQEFYGEDRKPGFEVLHTTNVMLVDAAGRVIDMFDAQHDEEMSALFKAIRQEAQAAGK